MNVGALLVYLVVQGITPGPSNFMSLYTAATFGFRGGRPYRMGSLTGFCVKMLLCGLLNMLLADVLPDLVPVLKWVGVAYLLYLAVHIIVSGRKQAKQNDDGNANAPQGLAATFLGGITLQVMNIKSWIMGLTAFSMYITPYTTAWTNILFWTLVMGAIMFACTLLWAGFGNAMKRVYAKYRLPCDIVFAAALVYSAISTIF
ncbi:LysE family transporter [Christensenellaceae bacterium OttesenSCG-928-L17]|nr:LysE family transporter [Christensenellaceae bacterium OttesenSCG-928-L17]